MISEIVAASDVDLAHDLPADADRARHRQPCERTRALARMITGLEAGTVPAKEREVLLAAGGEGEDPDARRHGHRRRGQELAHRRDRPPLPARPAGPAADRDHLDRSVAAQVRRRAARRPHPDERDRAPEHLHALARHARRGQRSEQGAARRHRRLQGRRRSTSSSSRLPASARATPRSRRWSTSRST